MTRAVDLVWVVPMPGNSMAQGFDPKSRYPRLVRQAALDRLKSRRADRFAATGLIRA